MRVILEKAGITIDVPENEVTNYLRLGYVKVGEAPDALPEEEQKPTAEQLTVNEAVANLVEAEQDLSEAENELNEARSSTPAVVEPEEPKTKGKGK